MRASRRSGLDLDNERQPDGLLIILPECGGQARISNDDDIEGAPELVDEEAARIDLGKKFDVYRRNGVRDYVVWRMLDRQVDGYANRAGRFERVDPTANGILRGEVFPGLWLDAGALVGNDRKAVQAALQPGLDSPEHAEFVTRLARDRRV